MPVMPKIKEFDYIEQKCFYLGVFFLSSALPISGLLFLIPLIFSFLEKNLLKIKDKFNLILLIIGGFMILQNINLFLSQDSFKINDKINNLIDLANWIPFFFLFIIFQKFLKTSTQRKHFSRILIIGSFPIFFSCILQAWFNVYGPFETLNGLIVWFQKPIEENHNGITGLFSNQNYTGIWLTAILPFLIAEQRLSRNNKLLNISLIILDIYLVFLTTSKNAFFSLFIILIMLFKIRSRLFITIFGSLGSYLLAINILNKLDFQNINLVYFPIYEKLSSFNFFSSSRYEIYKISSKLILQKPLLGWGKSIFPDLYLSNGGTYNIEHTHSIPLELGFNYGLIIAAALILLISYLVINCSIKIFKMPKDDDRIFFNKCWIVSTLIILISQLNDITYYDGKISLLIWILLSGTKCIFNDKDLYKVI